ncbi:MAG: hemerythrin domain-containing protein [Actinomycetota bacterium]
MDVISLLKRDHETVEGLFRRYESLGARDSDRRTEVVHEVIRELSVHAAIEEQFLYPQIKEALPDGEALAEEALQEHQDAKEVLAELDRMDAGDAGFDPKVRSLIADVRHHVEEEETELLPRFASAVPAEQLEQLGGLMKRAKAIAPTRPHPHAPSTPPGNLVAGPLAAVVDRVRDTVSGRPEKSSSPRKKTSSRSTSKKTASRGSSAKKTSARKTTSEKTTRRTSSTSRAKGPVIDVTTDPKGGWRAEKRGADRASARSNSKREVVKRARELAKSQGGRLVIRGQDGRIQEERSYGADPASRAG